MSEFYPINELSQEFKDIFYHALFYDLIIQIPTNLDQHKTIELKVHKFILASKSDYFNEELKNLERRIKLQEKILINELLLSQFGAGIQNIGPRFLNMFNNYFLNTTNDSLFNLENEITDWIFQFNLSIDLISSFMLFLDFSYTGNSLLNIENVWKAYQISKIVRSSKFEQYCEDFVISFFDKLFIRINENDELKADVEKILEYVKKEGMVNVEEYIQNKLTSINLSSIKNDRLLNNDTKYFPRRFSIRNHGSLESTLNDLASYSFPPKSNSISEELTTKNTTPIHRQSDSSNYSQTKQMLSPEARNSNSHRRYSGHIAMIFNPIGTTETIRHFFLYSIATIASYMESERATIFLFHTEKKLLQSVAAISEIEIILPYEKGLAGSCFSSRSPLISNDVSKNSNFFGGIDSETGFRTNSVLCAPFYWEGNNNTPPKYGVVQVLNHFQGKYTEAHKKKLGNIAGFIGEAIALAYREFSQSYSDCVLLSPSEYKAWIDDLRAKEQEKYRNATMSKDIAFQKDENQNDTILSSNPNNLPSQKTFHYNSQNPILQTTSSIDLQNKSQLTTNPHDFQSNLFQNQQIPIQSQNIFSDLRIVYPQFESILPPMLNQSNAIVQNSLLLQNLGLIPNYQSNFQNNEIIKNENSSIIDESSDEIQSKKRLFSESDNDTFPQNSERRNSMSQKMSHFKMKEEEIVFHTVKFDPNGNILTNKRRKNSNSTDPIE